MSYSDRNSNVYDSFDPAEGRASRMLVWSVLLVLIVGLIWAGMYELDEVSTAQGKVIPSSRGQVVQSLDPGILQEMLVKEGQSVVKGQVLLRLDDTRSGAIYREGLEKWLSLTAQSARLRAEVYGTALVFPKALDKLPDLVERETQAFLARKNALDKQVSAMASSMKSLVRELAITQPLVREGVVSEVELLRLRRQQSDLDGQMTEVETRYKANANNELVRVDSELAQTREILLAQEDTYKRSAIRAPMDGIVKDIRINTVGAVVGAGQTILEIVPAQEELLVEAFIPPSEIAYLHVGQAATVKLSAFDYSRYGSLEGEVTLISPDISEDESKSGRSGTNPVNLEPGFYKLLVRIKNPGVERKGMMLTPQPGMTATVDILTHQKTVLEYLFMPIQAFKQSLRER
jgi:adhesin transport system membrane fusion protein